MKRFYTLLLTAALIAASCQTEDKQCLEKLQQELSQWEQQSVPTVPQGDITAPSDQSFVFQFDKQRYGVDAAGSVEIAYTLSEAAEVTVQVRDGWSATVTGSGTAGGTITVTAPDPAMATDLIVTATAANGRQTAAILP